MNETIKRFARKTFSVYGILWMVYLSFLGVLLPHTAWTFQQFQQDKTGALGWLLAVAFEITIAAVTHKLSEHITNTPKKYGRWEKFIHRFVNGYSLVLVAALAISSLTNLAYAVEFAGTLRVFAAWGIPQEVYEFSFGAVLPFLSLGFALILSDMAETEQDDDPRLVSANETIRQLREQNRESERARREAEHRATAAERRFEAAGDLMAILTGQDKKAKVIAIRTRWPELTGKAIAVLADSSPAYVSEVLAESVTQ